MSNHPVKIFIGSGEQSLLERKVLIHSLRKHSRRELDIHVINGTHNAIERNDEPPVPAPLSLRLKYKNATEFSLYRYLIPRLCDHQGRAIYLDADMISLGDIGELFDRPMDGKQFLAKPGAFKKWDFPTWALSTMLIDCAQCDFDLERIYDEIEAGAYTWREFAQMHPVFMTSHPYAIGPLDEKWNQFDHYDAATRIIHYTNLYTQPWKYYDHPAGDLWYRYFQEAQDAGVISDEDIETTIIRGYVRQDIRKGNASPPCKKSKKGLKRRLKRLRKRLKG